MMHGSEKSDPLDSTGEAGEQSGMRPRRSRWREGAGPKGMRRLQSRVRTQSREAVSQAQARIREAVNRNRKEKLTALLHHINVDVLRAAFLA